MRPAYTLTTNDNMFLCVNGTASIREGKYLKAELIGAFNGHWLWYFEP